MQCLSQLITKEQMHLSKIWDTVQHVQKRMRSYLSGRRINITLTFMSSSSYLVHAISCSNNSPKISPFVMFIIIFLFLVSPFYFYFLFFTAWPTTRHALPVTRYPSTRYPSTRYPSPVIRHPSPVSLYGSTIFAFSQQNKNTAMSNCKQDLEVQSTLQGKSKKGLS